MKVGFAFVFKRPKKSDNDGLHLCIQCKAVNKLFTVHTSELIVQEWVRWMQITLSMGTKMSINQKDGCRTAEAGSQNEPQKHTSMF